MYISKLDSIKALNDITFNIGAAQTELDTINKNQRNIDIISKAKEDASLLRKKIQIENQEVFKLFLFLTFYSNDFKKLSKTISSIKAKFYSKSICSEVTNFRHLELYKSNIPLNILNESILNNIYITTDALSNIFPFYTNNFIDSKGIIVGYTDENRLCILDIFCSKYENANICIFGCSGSGKSYFTKLFVIRNFFHNKKQIILDVEGEYLNICSNLKGEVLFNNTYYNLLEITKKDLEKENYLDNKIEKIILFISNFCKVNEEKLSYELYKLYNKFGITNNIDSVVILEENEEYYMDYQIINKEKFPTLLDLIDNIEDNELKNVIEAVVNNELKYFSRKTSINIDNNLFVLNMQELIHKPKIICVIMQYILENNLGDKETIIYIDELWKYSMDENILNCIFNMYKTIRKRKASIITITQDITDFFEYKNGMYANSILNNSSFKIFFKTNFNNNKILNIFNITNEKLINLKKSEAIVLIDKNNLKLKIKANNFEREIINENDYSNK